MSENTLKNIYAGIAHARFAKGMGHNEDLFPCPGRNSKRSGRWATMRLSFAGTMATAQVSMLMIS